MTVNGIDIGLFAGDGWTYSPSGRELRLSGLGERLDGVFISDEIGCEKPDSGFFAPVFAALGDTAREDILIVGDSLTSDMQGGLRVGIRTCWFRHPGKENTLGLPLDYVVDRLPEVLEIISGENGTRIEIDF